MKPRRKTKALYERAAIAAYVRCPISQQLMERPAGSTLPLHLPIGTN